MLYIHPVLQALFTLCALYALWLAKARWQSLHLGKSTRFNRSRHALMGKIALVGWLVGAVGGAMMMRLKLGGLFVTGLHYQLALVMAVLIIFGLGSGLYLERKPAPRKLLPFLHGLVNLALVFLALFQVAEGWEVIRDFVQGG